MVIAAYQHNRLCRINDIRRIPEIIYGYLGTVFKDHSILRDPALDQEFLHYFSFGLSLFIWVAARQDKCCSGVLI